MTEETENTVTEETENTVTEVATEDVTEIVTENAELTYDESKEGEGIVGTEDAELIYNDGQNFMVALEVAGKGVILTGNTGMCFAPGVQIKRGRLV